LRSVLATSMRSWYKGALVADVGTLNCADNAQPPLTIQREDHPAVTAIRARGLCVQQKWQGSYRISPQKSTASRASTHISTFSQP